jgi:hypothetical protein
VPDQPEYLRKLLQKQERPRPSSDPVREGPLTPQEQEALRWARETAGTDLRSVRGLAGARYAVLVRVQSATGVRYHSVEGLRNREALMARLMPEASLGEEIIAAYEVRGGRPVTIQVESGEVRLRMGAPRPGAKPVSPEKMLRQAAAQAARRSRTRGDRADRGGSGGRGGRG